jgi:putative thioredoxin
MSHDLSDFQTDILDRSQQTPVLVDFWAAWCGPCKQLGPVVEKLAAEAAGRWVLVKIDTEAHPDLAARFGIRGIPNLKLFHRGAVIAELAGALPESQLRAWLEQHLPTPKRATMARARELLHAGRADEAATILQPLAAAGPADLELSVLLARAAVFTQPAAALARVEALPAGHPWEEGAQIVKALAAALQTLGDGAGQLPAGSQRDRYLAALGHLQRQDFRAAAAGLVGVLQDEPGYDQGRAKAACLGLFKHLGLRHAITEEFFRPYSMAVNI